MVTVSSLIRLTLREGMIFLEIITIPSSVGSVPSCINAFFFSLLSTEKISSIYAWSAPQRITSFDAFPPNAMVTEPIMIDLPAPVSPVSIFSPSPNSTSAFSIRARFFTWSSRSMLSLSFCCPCQFLCPDPV